MLVDCTDTQGKEACLLLLRKSPLGSTLLTVIVNGVRTYFGFPKASLCNRQLTGKPGMLARHPPNGEGGKRGGGLVIITVVIIIDQIDRDSL